MTSAQLVDLTWAGGTRPRALSVCYLGHRGCTARKRLDGGPEEGARVSRFACVEEARPHWRSLGPAAIATQRKEIWGWGRGRKKVCSGSPCIQDWRAEAGPCALDQAHETRASLRPESQVISMGRARALDSTTLCCSVYSMPDIYVSQATVGLSARKLQRVEAREGTAG